jgi:predicted DNA-binding transcriptional regulator
MSISVRKLFWIALIIVAGYFIYSFLLAPSNVTIERYMNIQSGMSRRQVESILGTGLLRYLLADVGSAMEVEKEIKGEEILSEVEREMQKIKATMNNSHNAAASKINSKIDSKEGTLNSKNKFVPAKSANLHASSSMSGGICQTDIFAEYEFHGYLADVTVNNNPWKLLRNGTIFFNPKHGGTFESWKKPDGRIITVLFINQKASYWSYQGPAADFSGVPPLIKDPNGLDSQNSSPPVKTPAPEKQSPKTSPAKNEIMKQSVNTTADNEKPKDKATAPSSAP